MAKAQWVTGTALLIIAATTLLAGCGPKATPPKSTPPVSTPAPVQPVQPVENTNPTSTSPGATTPGTNPGSTNAGTTPTAPGTTDAGTPVKIVANPADIGVLVNKVYMLPDGYVPSPMVEPNVPFIFQGHDEKREMRQDAAKALEVMFAAALKDGVKLAGVSGYRSHTTQTGLYNVYLNQYGKEWVDKYSAVPGHSEHETGLAIDVSGIDGKCAADDCFADTPEANWIAAHSYQYGFIVRYPKGKDAITGYTYEPWHIRYVGTAISTVVHDKNETLEEYYSAKGQ